jgi:hypothetical protein
LSGTGKIHPMISEVWKKDLPFKRERFLSTAIQILY